MGWVAEAWESIVIDYPRSNHGAAALSSRISLTGMRLPMMRHVACGRGA
jgi:hypothetical protein